MNNFFIKSLILILFINPFALAAEITSSNIGLTCKKSKAPLFTNSEPFNSMPMDIITDYEALNKAGTNQQFKAVISLPGIEGNNIDFIPVLLAQRGNSRRTYCEFKPLRIIFLDQKIESLIEEELGDVGENQSEYMAAYYKALETIDIQEEQKYVSQDNNIFDKIGDDVKLVTHCGVPSWEHIGGQTVEDQVRRINEEYLIYQMLSTLKTTTFNTRLTQIVYRNTDGSEYFSGEDGAIRPGFFREPKSEVADRCKFAKPEIATGAKSTRASEIQAHIIFKFVFQNDFGIHGHNTAIVNNNPEEDKEYKFYIPYDYDLSGITAPEYGKNVGYTIESNATGLDKYARGLINNNDDLATAKMVIKNINANISKMDMLINDSPLSDDRKDHFQYWLKTTTQYTKAFPELIPGGL